MYTIISNDPKVIELARANGDKVVITNSDRVCAIDKELNKLITDFLTTHLNIPVHINGFLFIKSIFMKSIATPGFEREHITRKIYPYIADIYCTETGRVERNIRHAIQKGFERSNIADFQKIFGNVFGVPSNKCFIVTAIQYFKDNFLQ